MPLIQSPTADIRVWKVEESLEDLHDLLRMQPVEIERFAKIKHDKRKMEWLAARCLLQEAGIPRPLHFLDNGKPYLPDGPHLSLTHCKDYVAIILSDKGSMGLDIQNPDPKLKVISPKYCSKKELTDAAYSSNELAYLTRIWSAKEAVFKVFGEKIIFNEQMHVLPFLLEDPKIQVRFIHENRQEELFDLRVDAFPPDYNLVSIMR